MRISVICDKLSVSSKRVVSVLSPLASKSCGGSHIVKKQVRVTCDVERWAAVHFWAIQFSIRDKSWHWIKMMHTTRSCIFYPYFYRPQVTSSVWSWTFEFDVHLFPFDCSIKAHQAVYFTRTRISLMTLLNGFLIFLKVNRLLNYL